MEKLVEIMLNEGIDEDTVTSIVKSLLDEGYISEEIEEEKVSLSENCFNDIISLVEELIYERNKNNREAKKEWEKARGEETSDILGKDNELKRNQQVIKYLKKVSGPNRDNVAVTDAVDIIGKANRKLLGREQNPVSFKKPSEWHKQYSAESRTKQSQRGSTKDSMLVNNDPLHVIHRIVRGRLADDNE